MAEPVPSLTDASVTSILEDFDEAHSEKVRARVRELIAQSFSPPPRLTVSEWADDYRVLSPEASSEPGKWSTARVEPSRGIMDAFSDPEIETVTAMVAAQTVKTEVILNLAGFHVHLDPCPMLILQPTLQMAEAFSKDRLAPMLRDTPVLSAKIGQNARDSEDTILHKKYLGGHITMAGANSPASLASRPIRILMCDEVDRYEASAGKEGDPVSLAIERTTTFHNRKICLVSTPTIKGLSRIEASYEESDQRRFFVPCPKCGHEQHLKWTQVDWPGRKDGAEERPEEAAYVCEGVDAETGELCAARWSEAERLEGISRGRWISTRPEVKNHAGFHMNRIASPWRPLADMARDFVTVRKFPERLKTWINTRLAETWEERGERVDAASLLGRIEVYGTDPVPFEVGCITFAGDIQDDRWEGEWLGWGASEETWSLDYRIQYGDPSSPDFWARLDDALLRPFKHPSGIELRAEASCIDAGGHFTQQVYEFCRPRFGRRVYPILGRSGPGRPIWPPKLTKNAAKKIDVAILGVDQGKDLHYKRLMVQSPGPGYCHFPDRGADAERHQYSQSHFDGLTAEKAMQKVDRRGFTTKEWVKTHVRNEPLDVRVYNIAARLSLGLDMARRMAALRQAAEFRRQNAPVIAKAGQEEPEERQEPPQIGRRRVRSRGISP